MIDSMKGLYDIIVDRKENKRDDSYTCYLLESGLDKILKKCGEECSEMIIASKNDDKEELANEMCDLLYHMMVLMAQTGVEMEDVANILEERRQKIGNLKKFKKTDKNS